jgi:hypothetical protein
MNVNGPIAHFFNGVSQQPASQRHSSQVELQENAWSTIARGVGKRAPTEHIARLTTSTIYHNSFFHAIDRDESEKYLLGLVNGDLYVFDFEGNQKTVAFPDGKAYLNSNNPWSEFAVVTVADHTFIVNKTIVTALTADTAAGSLTSTKQLFSDLAAPTGTGEIHEIAGDPGNNFDNYYVKDTAPQNVWVETLKPGVQYQFDATTLPHKLVREADGTFTFQQITWADRLVGDEDSNPAPSFIGRTLRDIFFYRNRLGVLADEGFILSRPGEYFGFWLETTTAALDSDPIDSTVTSEKVSILYHAVPFNKTLLLFAKKGQFQLTAEGALTQKTARADAITEFETSTLCRPKASGTDLFMVTDKGDFCGVREYFVDEDKVTNDAADITAHVPSYIPKNVYRMAPCNTADALFLLTFQERNAIYVYKYYWGDEDKKLQSCWSKFVFDEGDVILDLHFVNQVAYLVVQRASGLYFEKMDMQDDLADDGLPFKVLLDRRVVRSGIYDPISDTTLWTLPYAEDATVEVVYGGEWDGRKGNKVQDTTRPAPNMVSASGDHSAHPCYVGRPYTQRLQPSEIFYRDQKNVAVLGGRLQLSRGHLAFERTGYFRVEVTPKARAMHKKEFNGWTLGDGDFVLDEIKLHGGVLQFPISAQSSSVTIEFVNDSHMPSYFLGMEWEGELVVTGQRVQ